MLTDHRRQVLRLVAGIVLAAVVIGVCVALLVIIADRFVAPMRR